MSKDLLNIEFKNFQGETMTLGQMNAKAFLIVNVASKCGLTPQYEGLQSLYEKYSSKGLEILGFPANEFLAQEPGSNEEIQDFCKTNYDVTFPVLQKIVVKGEGQHPLYTALTTLQKDALKAEGSSFEEKLRSKNLITGEPHDIKWNFEKFLVKADGTIAARFFPDVKPDDSILTDKIEELIS